MELDTIPRPRLPISAIVGFLILGVAMAHARADQLVGIHVHDGIYQLRGLDTRSPDRVEELGQVPASTRGSFQALSAGSGEGIGLVHEATDTGGQPLALVIDVSDPRSASVAEEVELPLPRENVRVRQVVVTGKDSRLVVFAPPGDRPPFSLATYGRTNGGWALRGQVEVPETTRLANLTICPDGTTYASVMAGEGGPQLAELDWSTATVVRRVPYRLGSRSLSHDVESLACGAGGQVYALADPRRSGQRSVYRVDTQSGTLLRIGAFDVESITLWPAGGALADTASRR